MPFNGDRLVDSLASDFGTDTGFADKLFYSIGKIGLFSDQPIG